MLNYEQAISLITSKKNFYIDLGLDRIARVLDKLGNPQDELKCIHVAGTNGKGSVCAMLESVLREAGYKTGLFTSPHIWEYTERIKVNGQDIQKDCFAKYVDLITDLGIHLTEFEILTVMMFCYFRDSNIDVAIIETGLGGRLDATNVIKQNLCSIITQIDLDHTDRLGDTKEKIAYEKAGIIKPNCPVITSMGYEVIKDKADEMNSLFIFVSPFVKKEFADVLLLKGRQQVDNLSLVITAINHLFPQINDDKIITGLKKVNHPCRFQYIEEKNLIVDGSHNPNGISALRENLDTYFPNQKRRYIFGALKTKDYAKMINILFREGDEIFFNGFDYPNACSYKELAQVCPFPAKPYKKGIIKADKLNIICGSFYMIGTMSEEIRTNYSSSKD